MMADDMELVREFATRQSDAAFETLVSRHLNLVYSVALRQVRDPHLAQEVAQAVFIILARKAGSLGQKTILSGWLLRTAQYASADALKNQRRRQHREQETYMQSILNCGCDAPSQPTNEEAWTQISPLLDAAMLRLGEKDRNAIVLRFFENKNLREVGAALGASEDSARVRINRALEKLRTFFTKRGVMLSATVIATAVSANSVQAAPVGLAATISAAAVKSSAVAASTLTLVKGALKIMAWTKMKTTVVAVAAVIVATGTTTLVIRKEQQHSPKPQPVTFSQTEFPRTSWRFAGYADPESAFLSSVWAVGNGDVQTFRNSLSPAQLEKFAGKPDTEIISAKDKADFSKITGFRILDKQVLSEEAVILNVYAEGLDKTQRFSLQRIGSDWKFDNKPKK